MLAVSHRQWHTGEAAGFPRQLRKLEKRWNLQWPMIQPVFTTRLPRPGGRLRPGPGRGQAERPGSPGVGGGARPRAGRLCPGSPRPDGFLRPLRGGGLGSRPLRPDPGLPRHRAFPRAPGLPAPGPDLCPPGNLALPGNPQHHGPQGELPADVFPGPQLLLCPPDPKVAAHEGRLAGGKAAGMAPGRVSGAGPPRRPPTARGGPPGGRPGQAGHRPPPVPVLPEIAVHLAQDALVAEILDVSADRSPASEPRPGLRASGPAGSPWPCRPEPESRVGAGLWGE